MANIRQTDIQAVQRGDNAAMRRVLVSHSSVMQRIADKLGINVDDVPDAQLQPPRPASIAVTGSNGRYTVTITNPLPDADFRAGMIRDEPPFQGATTGEARKNRKMNLTRQDDGRRNQRILHELQSSTSSTFNAGVITYGPSEQKQYDIPDLGSTRYWRVRSRFEDSPFNDFTVYMNSTGPVGVASGTIPATSVLYDNGLTVQFLKPAEAGADSTTGKSLTVLTDRDLGNISDAINRKARTAAHSSYRPLADPLTSFYNPVAAIALRITIASFTMRVAGVDIAITGATLTNGVGGVTLTSNTVHYVYYDDVNFAGGAVSFAATTTKETALAGDARFFVGSIRTSSGDALTTRGNNDGGAGAQYGKRVFLRPGTVI